jgi:cytosine/adenosine deaminase-related metal-dependent hydrolase
MAAQGPAELLGLPAARLMPGDTADLVLFDLPDSAPLQVRGTILAGQLVHGTADSPHTA